MNKTLQMAEVVDNSSTIIDFGSKEVIKANRESLIAIYTGDMMNAVLDEIKKQATDFEPDIYTAKGKKEIASIAFKVRRTKTTIDNVGKELTKDWKAKAKAVDAQRRAARDFLDKLAEDVRQPLTELEEAEKARIENIKGMIRDMSFNHFSSIILANPDMPSKAISRHIKEIENIVIDEESFQEFAGEAFSERDKSLRFLREKLETRIDEEESAAEIRRQRQEQLKKEQEERERRIAQKAAERAKREAEEAARLEKEKLKREKYEAEQALIRAEQEKKAAIETERINAELKSARIADKKHRDKIYDEAVESLCEHINDKNWSRYIINIIEQGSVKNVSLNY
jgi:colicin import membrane protein